MLSTSYALDIPCSRKMVISCGMFRRPAITIVFLIIVDTISNLAISITVAPACCPLTTVYKSCPHPALWNNEPMHPMRLRPKPLPTIDIAPAAAC